MGVVVFFSFNGRVDWKYGLVCAFMYGKLYVHSWADGLYVGYSGQLSVGLFVIVNIGGGAIGNYFRELGLCWKVLVGRMAMRSFSGKCFLS